MNIRLLCSRALHSLLAEHLDARGWEVGEEGDVTLVERGQEAPDQGVIIRFSPEDLETLTGLFDTRSGRREGIRQVIGGWHESKETFELIPHDRILYIEAMGNSVYLVTPEQSLSVKSKLYELEHALRAKGFIRISKSLIVNIVNVREIVPWFGGRYVLRLTNNKEVEVSRTYMKDFRAFLEI
ncbi:LytTR family DNA-binding domain-containing protein [Sporomusa acidovorans]|uniref:HTH LytTR-type domain-containing protein n=1 Tax=Sporomusa acidovorans (strain ATCC 49682 / DSM 3132 / Mol) TaxID=1123286 RepID=A0ABZ3J5S2_SPOA4|nr:LytTR family DNA-binding domain-containing protein [Sporomusa acidovorans]OZC18241.1 transcriptional regulatory protein YpdB [Sporomusa acidovorans DSM 3132]SDF25691.1 transcriptional regulator, LytTR family [Sporomusa acidovorans]